MKILIINPNSDPDMTADIQRAAERFASGRFDVDCRSTPGAPPFIETYEDQALAGPGMVRLLRENLAAYDAFVLACHCDPHLDALKEISPKPVVGIGEASMKIASMLGHRFSVVSTDPQAVPLKEELVRKYNLGKSLASVRAPRPEEKGLPDEERYLATARAAVAEDGAEVIVLGCAGLAGLDKQIQAALSVPVLDGVSCALILAFGLACYGVTMSKAGRYRGASGSEPEGSA
jgi:allantoin racemase